MLRNIISVIAGYLVWTFIFLGGGAVVQMLRPEVYDENGITSDATALSLVLLISIVASLAGGFLTARIAVVAKMRWVGILAVCLLATGIPVQITAGAALPVWYNLMFLVQLVPMTLIGGTLGKGKSDGTTDRSIAAG